MSVEIVATYENIPTGSMQNSTTTGTYAKNYSQDFVNFNDFKTYRTVPKYATLEERKKQTRWNIYKPTSEPTGLWLPFNIDNEQQWELFKQHRDNKNLHNKLHIARA